MAALAEEATSGMAEHVIVAEDLTKVYKMGENEVHALRGLS